jgi:serine/threonine-protein kinase SRPK3
LDKANSSIDLHTGNIAFSLPPLDSLSEETLLNRLGKPHTGLIRTLDGKPLSLGMPKYLVWPANPAINKSNLDTPIKLIDFGESFLPGDKPQALHTPLVLRAPELLLGDDWDFRADLWTLGCTVSDIERS